MIFEDFSFELVSDSKKITFKERYGKDFSQLAREVFDYLILAGVTSKNINLIMENSDIWGEILSPYGEQLKENYSFAFGNSQKEMAFIHRLNAKFY